MKKYIIKPLDFKIETKSATPVYQQVKQAIKLLIISGYLEEGDQLVSIRDLGSKLKIHPNTIVKVYYQLEVEGFIYSRPGAGYYVMVDHNKIKKEKKELFEKITTEYVSNSMEMGYSPDEIIKVLKKTIKKIAPSLT